MYIVKILKRGDAASVVVAIILAMAVYTVLPILAGNLSGLLSGAEDGYYYGSGFPGASWRNTYLQPIVSALLQVLILEIGLRIVVAFRSVFVRKGK